MNITVKNWTEANFRNTNSYKKTDESNLLEVITNFNNKEINGWYKEICFKHFKVSYGAFDVYNLHESKIDFVGNTVELTFILEGELTINTSDNKYYSYKSCEHNLSYYTTSTRFIMFKKGHYRVMKINLSPIFFNDYFPNKSMFKKFEDLILNQETGIFNVDNFKITSEISFVLHDIFYSKRQGYYRKIHLNSKVFDLILLQLNQFKAHYKRESLAFDHNKIIEIKEYIVKNYTHPLTLEYIAKKFGTNEFTLKKNFKAYCGKTVFGYIFDLKMEKSKKLLNSKKYSISEISEIVGYKNPQHFSTAFKKKYGIPPSKINDLI